MSATTHPANIAGHAETFGLPECDRHLIAKLRNMDPALRASIMLEAEYRTNLQERGA